MKIEYFYCRIGNIEAFQSTNHVPYHTLTEVYGDYPADEDGNDVVVSAVPDNSGDRLYLNGDVREESFNFLKGNVRSQYKLEKFLPIIKKYNSEVDNV